MWYIIRISFERVLRNIQKISFKDLGTMLYQGSIHYPVGKLVISNSMACGRLVMK